MQNSPKTKSGTALKPVENQRRSTDNGAEGFDALRSLLLADEMDGLKAVQKRVDAIESFHSNLVVRRRKIAEVLPDALSDAGHHRTDEVVKALGPAINQGVRAEMLNSRDEMVAAIQPLAGRLVTAAVADSFSKLSDQVNKTIETLLSWRGVKLRLKALITGHSISSLVLSEMRTTEVERIYLIERGAGKLLFCWTNEGLVSVPAEGTVEEIMTTVHVMTEFAPERQDMAMCSMTLSDSEVVLQASPKHVVAIEARGMMSDARKSILSNACRSMLSFAATHRATPDAPLDREAMTVFATQLVSGQPEKKESKHNPAKILGIALLIAIAAWFGWRAYHTMQINKAATNIKETITRNFKAGDVIVVVEPDRATRTITVNGIGFGTGEATAIERRAYGLAQPYDLQMNFMVRDLDSARLERDALAASLADAQVALADAKRQMERLSVPPPAPVVRADPVADLRDWMAGHAVFFSEGTTPRDSATMQRNLDTFAALLNNTPNSRIRVKGYSDPDAKTASGRVANVSISEDRAAFIGQQLGERGIAAERIILVGHGSADPVSTAIGLNSPNRRVEFSLAFANE